MESKEVQTAPEKHFLRSLEKKREKNWNRRLGVGSLLCLQAEGEKPTDREEFKFKIEGGYICVWYVGWRAGVERDGDQWSQFLNELRSVVVHKK